MRLRKVIGAGVAVWGLLLLGAPALAEPRGGHPEGVVLVNPFVVPPEALDETILMWERARDFLATQPGYISTKLHQALSPDAQYLLINVATWASVETFKAAIAAMRQQADLPKIEGVIPAPQLYKVIRE